MKRGSKAQPQFAVCVDNTDYPAALELRKIYRAVPDASAAARRLIRIIDESGEDYLYPQQCFIPLELPQILEEVLLRAS
jgi:hypothetical protein